MNILEGEPRRSELLSSNLCQTVQGPIGTGECAVQRPEDREGVLERPTLVWCRLIFPCHGYAGQEVGNVAPGTGDTSPCSSSLSDLL